MESKEKHNIMKVKQWLVLKPQFIIIYCPETFLKMARRLSDRKDFKLFSIINNFPKTGEQFFIENFESDEIHLEYSIHRKETGEFISDGKIEINKFGKIEINKLP
jgi:hypothetical protein